MAPIEKKIKVVIAKLGLDGHDRGAKLLCRVLAESGMEVVYSGLRQTPEMIVETVLQEDADAIGLSSLSGAHTHFFPRVMQLLKEKNMENVLVVGGGIIPEEDVADLKKAGIAAVFGPGASTGEIAKFIKENVQR